MKNIFGSVFCLRSKSSIYVIAFISNLTFTLISFQAKSQWVQLNAGTHAQLNEVCFTARDTGYIVGSAGTILKTNNGGQTWIALTNGKQLNLHDLYFLNANEGWVVGDSGLISHTTNGGMTWSNSYLSVANEVDLHSVTAFDENMVFVGGANWMNNDCLFRSINGGIDFQAAEVETYLWTIDITKIGMVNSNSGYALTRGMVLKTTDAGLHWNIADTNSVYRGAMYSVLEDFSIFPNNDTLFACGWYPAYFGRSISAAEGFSHNYQQDYTCMDFLTPLVGYVGGWRSLRKTTDGGHTFVDASGGDTSLFAQVYGLDFWDEQTGYVCGKNGLILKTTNGGGTRVGLHNSSSTIIEVFPNPTAGPLRFTAKLHATLTDLQGRELLVQHETNSLDLSTLAAGIYVLSLNSEMGALIKRVKIVKR